MVVIRHRKPRPTIAHEILGGLRTDMRSILVYLFVFVVTILIMALATALDNIYFPRPGAACAASQYEAARPNVQTAPSHRSP